MYDSFVAYHGSQHGDCGFDPTFENRYGGAMFFSLAKEHAKSFSKRANVKNVCTFRINAPMSSIFDSANDSGMIELGRCLRGRFEQYRVDSIMQEVAERLWTSFDPGSWPGSVVSECIKSLGYVGWFERETSEAFVGNFGLYDPSIAELISIEHFCDDCEALLQKSPRGSYICGSCDVDLCPKCFSEMEWDEDEAEWAQGCGCNIEEDFDFSSRKNPAGYRFEKGPADAEDFGERVFWYNEASGDLTAIARIKTDQNYIEDALEYVFEDAIRDLKRSRQGGTFDDADFYEIREERSDLIEGLDLEDNRTAYLSEIKIFDNQSRGSGLGSGMLEELESYLKGHGFTQIVLQAVPESRAGWYMRSGYQLVFPYETSDIGAVYPVFVKYLK